MAGIGKAAEPFRVCVFHHCASVPPGWVELGLIDKRSLAGMSMQAVVSPRGLRRPVVPACTQRVRREKWADLCVVCGRPVGQLLVEHYERGQYGQRVEREPEQRQREQQH